MKILHLSPPEAIALWRYLEPLVQRWLKKDLSGEYGVSDIFDEVCTGRRSIWAAVGEGRLYAFVTTYDALFPRQRTLIVHGAAGEQMREWLPLMVEAIEAYAQRNHFTKVWIHGRRGWERVLPRYQFRVACMGFVKQIREAA